MLPARSISVISVQAPTELNTKISTNWMLLPSGVIPLAGDHKINNKHLKLLKILNTEHNTVQISRRTIIGKLQPMDDTHLKVNNISWTIVGTASTTGRHMELPCMAPESSFQPYQHNAKQSTVLQGAQIPQDAKDGLVSLLGGEFSSIISRSPTDMERTNLFQMDIPMIGLPVTYQKFINEEIKLIENSGCISKSLSPWTGPVTMVTKNFRSLKPS